MILRKLDALVSLVGTVLLVACASDAPQTRSSDALATVLTPEFPPDYYVDQANKYFDTLDLSADPESVPTYSTLVARWELPPWLLLTGYGRENMVFTTEAALIGNPSTVPTRDCRAFEAQPFARCYVVFEYEEGSCPIYEEFVFNDQGEMTFIEAWSDLPGLLPMADPNDVWGEGPDVARLSTRIPGLGNDTGLIDIDSDAMQQAANEDAEIAEFVRRARDFWPTFFDAATADPDYYARGCGWID